MIDAMDSAIGKSEARIYAFYGMDINHLKPDNSGKSA